MMGLLMSDTLLIDSMVDDTMRLLDNLREWPYLLDAARDPHEADGADPIE